MPWNNRCSRVWTFLNSDACDYWTFNHESWTESGEQQTFEAYLRRFRFYERLTWIFYIVSQFLTLSVHVYFRKEGKLWNQMWDVWNVKNDVVKPCGRRALRMFLCLKQLDVQHICVCACSIFGKPSLPQWSTRSVFERDRISPWSGAPRLYLAWLVMSERREALGLPFVLLWRHNTFKWAMWESLLLCTEYICM